MKLQIITIATNQYKEHTDKFLNSLSLFFPGHEKLVTLVTDDVSYFDGKEYDGIKLELVTTFFLSRIQVFLNKPAIIAYYTKEDYDYTLYADVDLYFFDLGNEKEEGIINLLNNDKIIIPEHIRYSYAYYDFLYNEDQRRYRIYDMELLKNEFNDSPDTPWHIPLLTQKWVMTNFLFAKSSILKELSNYWKDVYSKFVSETLRVPKYHDETVINYIIYQNLLGKGKLFNFHIGTFISNQVNNFIPSIICYC